MIEVRETELTAQGGKSVKTESVLQLSTVSKPKPSTAVPSRRYQKSVKAPKVVDTIQKKLYLKRPIPISASSPAKAPISTKHLVKKLKEKGVLIPVRKGQKRKSSLRNMSITGMDEALVIDCVSISQSPNVLDTRWHDIATNFLRNLLRFARSCASDSTDADENLALQDVMYGIQISPCQLTMRLL